MKRVLLFAMSVFLPLGAAQENTSVVDVEQLAALILGQGEKVVFLPGHLPDNLTLPLPENARLRGSAVIGEDRFVVALELEADFRESERRVGGTLQAAGWSRYSRSGPTVFVSDQGEDETFGFADYCNPERTREVSFNTSSAAATTLVLLDVGSYCSGPDRELAPLPSLALPVGLNFYGGSLGQTSDSFNATARYTSSLETQTVFDDFVTQLEAQGWQTEEVMREGSALSTNLSLELPSGRWRGLLTVTDEGTTLQVARLP